MAREGAKHLYLLDYDDTHLPSLVSTLQADYPGTKVSRTLHLLLTTQVSYVKADAASEPAVIDIVNKALNEEGHLDFYFANAGISQLRPKADANAPLAGLVQLGRKTGDIPHEEFTEIMRINALRWVDPSTGRLH